MGPGRADPRDVVSYRQNLEPLVEDGKLLPSGRTQWGWQLNGTSMMTERSGICVTDASQLYYVWGDEVSAQTLGKAMILAGCTYGMHLDMNPHHTGFVFANVRTIANKDYDVKLLTPLMDMWPERYLEYSPKDFFYLMLRDPTPAGDVAWTEDVGTQPAPTWLPTVWHAMVQSAILSDDDTKASAEPPATCAKSIDPGAGRAIGIRCGACALSHSRGAARRPRSRVREHRARRRRRAPRHRGGRSRQPTRSAKWPGVEVAYAKLPPGALSADEATGLRLFSEAELANRKTAVAKADKLESIELPLILETAISPRPLKNRARCAVEEQHA